MGTGGSCRRGGVGAEAEAESEAEAEAEKTLCLTSFLVFKSGAQTVRWCLLTFSVGFPWDSVEALWKYSCRHVQRCVSMLLSILSY